MAAATQQLERREQLRPVLAELWHSFNERNLLTWASALSFQLVTTFVPALLFGLALLGFLDLQSVWADVAKEIRPHMSQAAFTVVEDTATLVLTEKQLLWLTLGGALAVWQLSGGVRAIMGGLADVYEIEENRPWRERVWRSLGLAAAIGALVVLAVGASWLGPLLYGDVGQPAGALLFALRWTVAGLLLMAAVALTLHHAPAMRSSAAWITTGALIIVGAWIAASLLFGAYIRFVADYRSIFGNLATIVVLFAYIYVSSIVFFAGARVDAIMRRRLGVTGAGGDER